MEQRRSSDTDASAPGYLVVVGRITQFAPMGAYAKALPPVYAAHGGAHVAIGGPGRGVDWLAGPHRDRSLVLSRFDSVDAVRRFWWSPEYRAAARLREGAGTFNVTGVPGLAGVPAPVGGSCLFVATIVGDTGAYEAWRGAYGTELAAHGGQPLASSSAGEWCPLEGDPPWDRLELAHLPTPAAAEALIAGPAGRELLGRAGLAFVARAAVVDAAP